MQTNEITALLICTAPIASGLLCLMLLAGYSLFHGEASMSAAQLRVMMLYYVSACFTWINPILYLFFPEIYVYVNASYYLSLLLVQVLFYHLIYILTGTGGENRFPRIHYIIPGTIVAVFVVWSLFVPFDVRLSLVNSYSEMRAGYEAYSLFSTNRLEVSGIYGVIYIMFGVRRLVRYRKAIAGYSADADRSSLQWLYILMALSVMMLPMPLLSMFLTPRELNTTFIVLPQAVILVVQYGLLCHNMLAGNYVIILPTDKQSKNPNRCLTKQLFELLMQTKKPYLNPELKITDLTLALCTNRTYLSGFINREYKMNFSRYINLQRLEELERLREKPEYNGLSEVGLILQAGFSSYAGYRRFVKAEESINKRPFVN